jgi:20S proteasome alpha/beta subunit
MSSCYYYYYDAAACYQKTAVLVATGRSSGIVFVWRRHRSHRLRSLHYLCSLQRFVWDDSFRPSFFSSKLLASFFTLSRDKTTMKMKHSILVLLPSLLLLTKLTQSQKFDPYKLNGGLIAAVAGRDYVLLASDTRLTDGGYGVQSRRYLSGRLWSASSSPCSTMTSCSEEVEVEGADETAVEKGSLVSSASNNNHGLLQSSSSHHVHWDSDGSLLLPSSSSPQQQQIDPTTTHNQQITITTNPPILIGSAGCASDCESLKRRMRLELDALAATTSTTINGNYNNSNNNLGVASVANLLQQILYSRRGFPFYSFCVVAGLCPSLKDDEWSGSSSNKNMMEGAVYVYDAIGSYERVAVGSAGTGRELLQPILDQLFSENGGGGNGDDQSKTIYYNDENHSNNGKSGDIMAIPPMKQRVGVAGSLRPPVQTTVRCSLEDAVKNVARAYQSVAEREISVGDEVVICVVKSSPASAGSKAGSMTEGAVLKVYRYPLKKH